MAISWLGSVTTRELHFFECAGKGGAKLVPAWTFKSKKTKTSAAVVRVTGPIAKCMQFWGNLHDAQPSVAPRLLRRACMTLEFLQ